MTQSDTQLQARSRLIPAIHPSWEKRENAACLMPQSCSCLSGADVQQTKDVNDQTARMAEEQILWEKYASSGTGEIIIIIVFTFSVKTKMVEKPALFV